MKKDNTPDLLKEVVDYTKRTNKFIHINSELTADERFEYLSLKEEVKRLRAEIERLKKRQI
jgi:hypothetical protein